MKRHANDMTEEQVAEHVAAFLKKGGTIDKKPYGPEALPEEGFITAAERKRLDAARKRASKTSGWKKSNRTIAKVKTRKVAKKEEVAA